MDLIEAKPSFARIRLSNGVESIVSTQDLIFCSSDLRIYMNDVAASDVTNQDTRSPTASDEIAHPMENHPNVAQTNNDFEHETPTHKSGGSEESAGPKIRRSTRIRHKPNRSGHNTYD